MFRALALKYHPDTGGNEEAFKKIQTLHFRYLDDWVYCGLQSDVRGFTRRSEFFQPIYFAKHTPIGFRCLVLTPEEVLWLLRGDLAIPMAKVAESMTQNLRYADKEMESTIKPFISTPTIEKTSSSSVLIKFRADAATFLEDVLAPLGPIYIAWILRRLYNLACWMQYNGLSFNSFSEDCLLVDQITHTIQIAGGWWYTTKLGEKLKWLPQSTIDRLPRSVLSDSLSKTRIDTEMIKAIGRRLLGADDSVPRMRRFLELGASDSAIKDYREWDKLLLDVFGPRKFVATHLPTVPYQDHKTDLIAEL